MAKVTAQASLPEPRPDRTRLPCSDAYCRGGLRSSRWQNQNKHAGGFITEMLNQGVAICVGRRKGAARAAGFKRYRGGCGEAQIRQPRRRSEPGASRLRGVKKRTVRCERPRSAVRRRGTAAAHAQLSGSADPAGSVAVTRTPSCRREAARASRRRSGHGRSLSRSRVTVRGGANRRTAK